MVNTVVNLKNINFMTEAQYESITPTDEELYAVKFILSLTSLSDVDSTGLTNDCVLRYDSVNQKWVVSGKYFAPPDFSAGVSMTVGAAAPSRGWFYARTYGGAVSVNGATVAQNGESYDNPTVFAPVDAGETISLTGSNRSIVFYPCKS